MEDQHVIGADSPVSCERLRVVKFSYIDFNGVQRNDGEVVVMDAVAQRVKTIFETLFTRKFAIAKAVPIEHYQGDDDRSMADNNTSAFNDRPITASKMEHYRGIDHPSIASNSFSDSNDFNDFSGHSIMRGNVKSIHAYGLAIDVNPIQNPYLALGDEGAAKFKPAAGSAYANRLNVRPAKRWRDGMAEEIIDLFADNGFLSWGGYWDEPIDYQHFQIINRKVAERLAQLPLAQAESYFESIISFYLHCKGAGQDAMVRAKCVERTDQAFPGNA